MPDLFPYPLEGSPESLVRRQLDAAARSEPGDRVVDRVLARLDGERRALPLQRLGTPRWRPALAAALVAASLLVGFFFLVPPSASATPMQLVEETIEANDPNLDRCYHLQVQRLDEQGRLFGPLVRESHLWTRGDRYRLNLLGDEPGSMGQDEHRRIWIAPTPLEGARFEPDEVPEKLALLSDLRTLRLDLLLRELTRGFVLEWDDRPTTRQSLRRILAVPRPGKTVMGIQRVLLEVDSVHKIVQHITVERVRTLQGRVRIALDRIAGQHQPDAFYHLESALGPQGVLLDRTQGVRRGKALLETVRRFGLPLGG